MYELENNPLESFLYAIPSPVTKRRYRKNIEHFFEFVGIHGSLDDKAKLFMIESKKRGDSWVFANLMKYMTYHKERVPFQNYIYFGVSNWYDTPKGNCYFGSNPYI